MIILRMAIDIPKRTQKELAIKLQQYASQNQNLKVLIEHYTPFFKFDVK